MSTTGRLTAAQREGILGGAPIRQQWTIDRPFDDTHAFYNTATIDVGVFPLAPTSEYRRVLRAGSRTLSVWNPSPNIKVNPKPAVYRFVVDNADGLFYDTTTDNFFKFPGGYQATPQECIIEHTLAVGLPSVITGVLLWSLITHMTYRGQVVNLRHENVATPFGKPSSTQTVITCEQVGAWSSLRRTWTVDDGIDHPMTDTGGGGVDFIWTIT